MRELVDAQDAYLEYIIRHHQRISWILVTRPMMQLSDKDIEEGDKLRENIKNLKEKFGIDIKNT